MAFKDLHEHLDEVFGQLSRLEELEDAISQLDSHAKAALKERMRWLRLSPAFCAKEREAARLRYRERYASDPVFRAAEIQKSKDAYHAKLEESRKASRERKRRYDERKRQNRPPRKKGKLTPEQREWAITCGERAVVVAQTLGIHPCYVQELRRKRAALVELAGRSG